MPVALITGASRGLGRQIALVLSEDGYSVSVNYVSSSTEAAHLIKTTGRNSVCTQG